MVNNQTLYCKINCILEKLNFSSIKETNIIIDNHYRNLKNFKETFPELFQKVLKEEEP